MPLASHFIQSTAWISTDLSVFLTSLKIWAIGEAEHLLLAPHPAHKFYLHTLQAALPSVPGIKYEVSNTVFICTYCTVKAAIFNQVNANKVPVSTCLRSALLAQTV